ncbi:MAG: hypothetical protein K8T89_14410 [Planctomycetes bacterium]|nr:hypothetical protein [Planctomycetota bacterium]
MKRYTGWTALWNWMTNFKSGRQIHVKVIAVRFSRLAMFARQRLKGK